MGLVAVSQAMAAEEPPYEFSAQLSLTGSCGTSKADPVPDPGCPEKKPPKPFAKPQGIAIDSFGDEYVASYGSEEGKQGRVDFFSSEGVFIGEVKDEFGPKALAVDSEGVLYVFDQSPGHDGEFARFKPKAYEPVEGKIEYGPRELIAAEPGPSEAGIAVDGNDHVFVDWPERGIKEYSSAAEGNELKATITNPKLQVSVFIALDKQRRRLYASACPSGVISECWVLVFDADTHELLEEVKGPAGPESAEIFASHKGWISVAVDEESGDFFVGDLELSKNVYQFNEDYEPVSTLALSPELFEGGEPLQIAVSNAEGAFNHRYLFVPSIKNRALAYSPPKLQPPLVEGAMATGIGNNEAELQALVQPRGGLTTYRFEYLSQAEYEEAANSFAGAQVAGEGTIQPSEQEAVVKAAISGLLPETEYRFRIVANNEVEIEGKLVGGEDEEQATFTTYNDAPVSHACENEALRTGFSALLPDCRAYELVTPPDTNGRPPKGVGFVGDQFNTLEASPGGEAVSFLTEGGTIPGLGGTGSLNGDLYHSARTEEGWQTTSAGPTGAETTSVSPGSTSPDQGYSFWSATQEGSAVIGGEATHYVRYPDGHSELIGRGSLGTDPIAIGRLITEGGTHIVFQTQALNGKQPIQLEEDAPPTGTVAVYDRTADEVTHVVSLLPGEETPKAGENAGYVGASADGEGIAFEIGKKLYLRVDDATTYEIGEGLTFAGVSAGGARIFYLEGGDLFAFDAETEKAIQFTEVGNAVPVNVSADGARAYFASTTAIAGSGENPNGDSAEAGKENLYLSEEGTIRFVGTVTERDVVGEENKNHSQVDGLGLWTVAVGKDPARDPSRTTPDGSVLLFSSRADLTGYAHEGVPEIYRYDSVSERLHCISCIPTKVTGGGGASLESPQTEQGDPEPFSASGFVQNLRADGRRAIFESTEALVSRDNDGVQDVYEWEEQNVGSCTRAGGCLYLISSGHSAKDNYLYGISSSGNDVFFTTSDILVGGDSDTVSIYDARVDGGFPEAPKEECEGEGCKPGLTPAPPLVEPAIPALGADDNVHKSPTKPCPKGKHRATRHGKKVCIKNKHHHRRHHKAKKGAGK
ncbi:MAG TPA: hypothetical protein VFX44_05775 [Solirubrobacterales bacterium]|nr:hypothetical protein [Solirubrobacterales bacterium]